MWKCGYIPYYVMYCVMNLVDIRAISVNLPTAENKSSKFQSQMNYDLSAEVISSAEFDLIDNFHFLFREFSNTR